MATVPSLPLVLQHFERFEWDIYLSSVNDLKAKIFGMDTLPKDSRREILLQSFPRFLWRAFLLLDLEIKLELIFDATDIEQGSFFIQAIEYDTEFNNLLRVLFNFDGIDSGSTVAGPIIDWFRRPV
ncbi:MAG: hypothetical protein ACRESZ_07840 [Methylococcales bacterium]